MQAAPDKNTEKKISQMSHGYPGVSHMIADSQKY